ncbi:MAG: zinc-dependent alcohol dehydrogenase family protein [Verrucomicrobiae bacterium]|nr:zinc-dependent alcohol dehydrogenase family protein [Verrucomicrobiae bacterium]
MKACLLLQPAPIESRPLQLAEMAPPTPRADELLVRVRACAVCRTDLHVAEGDLPARRSPVIPGHQVVGEVAALGAQAEGFKVGDRVGVAWLHRACGACGFCESGRENLCDRAEFTGWTAQGGYAEYAVAPAVFAYHLPEGFNDLQVAPLLCAGLIGYRALEHTGIGSASAWRGARVGFYGFGASAHVVIQLAVARGAEVYAFSRGKHHQALAAELGAKWVGGATDEAPVKLDAAIMFAPAGELVPVALRALAKGGTLVLAGIHMTRLPAMDYALLYDERVIRSVANNTRADGRAFLAEAARIPVRTHVQTFPLAQANEALMALKHGEIRGAAALVTPALASACAAASRPPTGG